MKHYVLNLFYKRDRSPKFKSLAGAKAHLDSRVENSPAETYAEIWEMSSETDGEMVGLFDSDGNALVIHGKPKQAKAKLRKV